MLRHHRHSKKQGSMGNIESCTSGKEEKKDDLFVAQSLTTIVESAPEDDSATLTSQNNYKHDTRRHSRRSLLRRSRHDDTTSVETEVSPHYRTGLVRSVSRRSGTVAHKTAHFFGAFFHAIDEWLFPKSPLHEELCLKPADRVRDGVLLYDCETSEDHYAKAKEMVEIARNVHGARGLKTIGFEYRVVLCEAHRPANEQAEMESIGGLEMDRLSTESSDLLSTDNASVVSMLTSNLSTPSLCDMENTTPVALVTSDQCHRCKRRLFHIPSNAAVTMENRRNYVADGDMYETVARLCQETAHEVMCSEGNLDWVIVEDSNDHRPIRALVNVDNQLIRNDEEDPPANVSNGGPTMLIATGKGKVQAGIFSRQHLMCTSMESATALPIVREAVSRKLNIVIVDPNAQGDQHGYSTFQKTMERLFAHWESSDENAMNASAPLEYRDLYILSHSASGSHVARYLLDKSDVYLPHIKAIAFTDSTHNIQWAKNADNERLYNMLQSPECVYFRCSNIRTDNLNSKWYLHPAGEEVVTDTFWQHRFGEIKTYWAGTNEHSLTNWYAHGKIWEHFDRYLFGSRTDKSPEEHGGEHHAKTIQKSA